MKYILNVPDGWDLDDCNIYVKRNGKVEIEKPIDHLTFNVSKTEFISINDDPYYGTLHQRIANCVEKLRNHFSLGYIVDSCDGIQALEITTRELMQY